MRKLYRNNGKAVLRLNQTQWQEIHKVNEKIKSGTYRFIDAACPVCNEKVNLRLLSEKDRYGFYYPVKICKTCGMVFASPRLREGDYEDFYKSGHQKRIYVGSDRARDEYFKIQYNKGKRIFSFVSPHLTREKGLRILEVGCGAGGILKVFKENNHHVEGIDLNPEYINFGRDHHDLNLSTQNLFDIENKEYDVVIYSHVLEHLMDPGDHLEFVSKLLSEKGLLYIEVPGLKNCYSFYGGFIYYLQNAHVMHFTSRTLLNLLHLNGYSCISQVNETIQSVWRYNPAQKEEMNNDYLSAMRYLNIHDFLPVRTFYYLKRKSRFIFNKLF